MQEQHDVPARTASPEFELERASRGRVQHQVCPQRASELGAAVGGTPIHHDALDSGQVDRAECAREPIPLVQYGKDDADVGQKRGHGEKVRRRRPLDKESAEPGAAAIDKRADFPGCWARVSPATLRFDALILGSTLGAVVAGAYLARAGLRVALFEEQLHQQRPPLLREPFLLSGLDAGGPLDRVLVELGVGFHERRWIVKEPITLQLLLEEARLDFGKGSVALARDLELYGLCGFDEALRWLRGLEQRGTSQREALANDRPIRREAGWTRIRPGLSGTRHESPPPPRGILDGTNALRTALCAVEPGSLAQAPAVFGPVLADGGFRMDHAGHPFSDLLRQRFLAFHGEIRTIERFALFSEQGEVGIDTGRQQLFAPLLVVGAPRALLRRFLEEHEPAPRWLAGTPDPLEVPVALVRCARSALPSGMSGRVVEADRPALRWISRSPDPNDPSIEWLVLYGPGAEKTPQHEPLGRLAPFAGDRSLAIETGPAPRWDRDGVSLRFLAPHAPVLLERRPLVVAAGPELAPDLGLEGEICASRRSALRAIEALGA